jgi:hypothetical protein
MGIVFFQDILFPLLILVYQRYIFISILTLILLTWTIWPAPTNASKWRMGFNSAFKGLIIFFDGKWANAINLQTKQSSFSYLGALDRKVLTDIFVFSRFNSNLFKQKIHFLVLFLLFLLLNFTLWRLHYSNEHSINYFSEGIHPYILNLRTRRIKVPSFISCLFIPWKVHFLTVPYNTGWSHYPFPVRKIKQRFFCQSSDTEFSVVSLVTITA